jgi:hypothetical protein
MADMEFDVAKRRNEPITFTLGGEMLLEPGEDEVVAIGDGDGKAAKPEVRGKDDHVYHFEPPKSAVMLMPILEVDTTNGTGSVGVDMTKATFDWLGQGLSLEDRTRVINRLRDPKDDLDVDSLSDVVQGLSARVAGRPTS